MRRESGSCGFVLFAFTLRPREECSLSGPSEQQFERNCLQFVVTHLICVMNLSLTERDTSNRNPEPIFTPRKIPRKFFAAEMVPGAAAVPALRGNVSNRPLLLLQWSPGSARHFQFATVQPHSQSIPAEGEGPGRRPRRRSIRRLRRPL